MSEDQAPPPRWLLDSKAERRNAAARYWIRDPVVGVLNIIIHYGVRLLPIDAASAVGTVLGQFGMIRYPQSAARARKLWMRERPNEADKASTDAAMLRLWRNVGRTMAEFSVIDRLWDAGRIELVDERNIFAARDTGRPIIGLSLHLGNWETIAVTVLRLGFKGISIYVPPANRFDHFIARQARRRLVASSGGDDSEPVLAGQSGAAEAFLQMKNQKRSMLLYADELARGRVWAPAFGRPLRAGGNVSNAIRLARLTRAQIVPIYSVRLNQSANFRVTFLPAVELIDTGDTDADLMANIAKLDALIEPIIRAHLDQWFFGLDFEYES